MVKYNQRKLQIFYLLNKKPNLKVSQIADKLNISKANARMCLLHYTLFNYLSRRGEYAYRYKLTKKGKRVLSFLYDAHQNGRTLKHPKTIRKRLESA